MTEQQSAAASWDLTSKVSPYLDLHMMFPLLEYVDELISKDLIPYSNEEVARARLTLLRPTHMVDYAIDIYNDLHGTEGVIPSEMEEQKKKVYETLNELKEDEGCKAFEELCNNQELRNKLLKAGEWNIPSLVEKELTTPENIETYRKLAKFNFDCGDYETASLMLSNIISLHAVAPLPKDEEEEDEMNIQDDRREEDKPTQKLGNPNVYYLTSINTDLLQILWGKLAAEILKVDWDGANVALTAVKLSIEQLVHLGKLTPVQALKERTWLLHWSLFVFWNKGGLESMVELFFSEKYLQAITTLAPHLLRYLTAAVLLCKRRVAKSSSKDGRSSGNEARKLMKDLVRTMNNCNYTDPICEFVDCLVVKFDFEMAQQKLKECELVLSTDFFLCRQTDLFMEEARVFVFENYCRIHNKIDLKVLGAKLAMNQDDAERWIVDLIHNALLDAKIDSEEGCVVMGAEYNGSGSGHSDYEASMSVYEKVMERTRDLNLRSAALVQNLKNVVTEAKKEKLRKEKAAMEEEEY